MYITFVAWVFWCQYEKSNMWIHLLWWPLAMKGVLEAELLWPSCRNNLLELGPWVLWGWGWGGCFVFWDNDSCFVVMPMDVATVVFKWNNQNMIVQSLLILKWKFVADNDYLKHMDITKCCVIHYQTFTTATSLFVGLCLSLVFRNWRKLCSTGFDMRWFTWPLKNILLGHYLFAPWIAVQSVLQWLGASE